MALKNNFLLLNISSKLTEQIQYINQRNRIQIDVIHSYPQQKLIPIIGKVCILQIALLITFSQN